MHWHQAGRQKRVASFTGARIETCKAQDAPRSFRGRVLHGRADRNPIAPCGLSNIAVASFTGARIETSAYNAASLAPEVASFTGARIETIKTALLYSVMCSSLVAFDSDPLNLDP